MKKFLFLLGLFFYNLCEYSYYTNSPRLDGFGCQYQLIIYSIIYAHLKKLNFVYTPIQQIEHNYTNDPSFLEKIEGLMNLKDNLPIVSEEIKESTIAINDFDDPFLFFEANIDYAYYSKPMQKIKSLFWQNKDKNFFKNNKFNIAVHVRRPNCHDCYVHGTDIPDNYYLKTIDRLRNRYLDKGLEFHIYSQGHKENFKCYESPDTKLHINEDLSTSFIGMAAANVLVTSASTFSYTAGLINEGHIYYTDFIHPKLPHWISIEDLKI